MDTESEGPAPVKVLVGMPCGDTMMSLTALHYAALLATSRAGGVEATPTMNMGSMAVNNRSTLARQARQLGCDALFLIDPDMIFPPNALLGLLAHGEDKDIVGATYMQRRAGGETHGFE